jgi:hypothetical protein
MNALWTSLVSTGSPSSGSASGLNSNAGVPGTNVPSGSALRWRTWITGAPRSRQPVVALAPAGLVERPLHIDDDQRGGGHGAAACAGFGAGISSASDSPSQPIRFATSGICSRSATIPKSRLPQ